VINVLVSLVKREDVAPAARISAGTALLDRGWGKPTQSVNLHDDRPQITEIVNEIIDPVNPDKPVEYLLERQGELISLPAPPSGSEPLPDPQPETALDNEQS
jgi:hypothetical protein